MRPCEELTSESRLGTAVRDEQQKRILYYTSSNVSSSAGVVVKQDGTLV